MNFRNSKTGTAILALTTLLPASPTVSAAIPVSKPSDKPNIVFILADDFGLDGVGCYGSDRFRGKTPNIDRLAENGIRFTQCYSMPLSGPSRCGIITGRYGFRTGGLSNQSAGQVSFKNEPSIAKTLKENGYVTGMAGKWRQMSNTPGDWGFDEWLTDPTAGGWYWKSGYTKNNQVIDTGEEVYNPDVCFDFAVDFFRRHRDKPFFFYFPTHLIHGPILRTPDSKAGTEDFYDDNVAYLDKQVGLLAGELEKLGLLENTLIVFVGDNGTAKFGSEFSFIDGRRINGQKGSLLEGGSRVPMIVSWKGVTPAGTVIDDLVDFTDFFATFVDMAGTKMPKGVISDGHSFAPQLHGKKGSPREWIFVQLGAKWYIRNQDFKLTRSGDLIDMRDAPFTEELVTIDIQSKAAMTARKHLQAVLDKLNPAGGFQEYIPEKNKQKINKNKKRGNPDRIKKHISLIG